MIDLRTKLKTFCGSCRYFSKDGWFCKISGNATKSHKPSCVNYIYDKRLAENKKFYCRGRLSFVTNKACENCLMRCVRSESRREVDYFNGYKEDGAEREN